MLWIIIVLERDSVPLLFLSFARYLNRKVCREFCFISEVREEEIGWWGWWIMEECD